MLRIENLSIKHTKKFYSLFNINLEFTAQEKVLLLGDIDSGNSLLLRCISQLDDYYRGRIFINDKQINMFNIKKFSIGYLPQTPMFFENKTVMYNLIYPLLIRKVKKESAIASANILLESLNLLQIADIKLKDLDSETRNKIAILRLIIRKPVVTLIDYNSDFDIKLLNQLIDTSEITLISCPEKLAKIHHTKTIAFHNGSIL